MDGQRFQLLLGASEDVQIHLFLNAWHTALIGVLPELSRPLVADAIDVLMRNPEGVAVEESVVEVLGAELISSIEHGGHLVVGLYLIEPKENPLLELLIRQPSTLFHIQYGWEVAGLQRHMLDEEVGLATGITLGVEVVVSTTNQAVVTS